MVSILEHYAAQEGPEHVLGRGGFLGEFMAFFGGVGRYPMSSPDFGPVPGAYHYLCDLVARVRHVRTRLHVERLIQSMGR
jgi:hypothetical protein